MTLSLLTLLTLSIGCASSIHRPMPPAGLAQIERPDVVVGIGQNELGVEIEQSQAAAAGGGGLLLALVDVAVEASRANRAEKAVAQTRGQHVEYEIVGCNCR